MKPLSLISRMCVVQGAAQAAQRVAVAVLAGQVADLVGIPPDVVELLGWLLVPEALLHRRHRAVEVALLPLLVALLLPHVAHVLAVGPVRHVVADVHVALVARPCAAGRSARPSGCADRTCNAPGAAPVAGPGTACPCMYSGGRTPASVIAVGRKVGELDRRLHHRPGPPGPGATTSPGPARSTAPAAPRRWRTACSTAARRRCRRNRRRSCPPPARRPPARPAARPARASICVIRS